MTRKTRSYQESLLEDLTDPTEAALYLNAAIEDSLEMFLVAVKDVAQARQMSKVAKESGVQRETLYRCFSESGNPSIGTITAVLGALGLKFSIKPEEQVQPLEPVASYGIASYGICSHMNFAPTAIVVSDEDESFGPLKIAAPTKKAHYCTVYSQSPETIPWHGRVWEGCGWKTSNPTTHIDVPDSVVIETSKTSSNTPYPAYELAKVV